MTMPGTNASGISQGRDSSSEKSRHGPRANDPRQEGRPALMSGSQCNADIKHAEVSEEPARNQPLRRVGAMVIMAVAVSLIDANSCVQAQQAPPLIGGHFVTVGGYHINL